MKRFVVNQLHKYPLSNVGHPLNRVLKMIETSVSKTLPDMPIFHHINPVVSTHQNFDELLIPKDHPSRSKHDSYYIDEATMFKTHLTSNEREILEHGIGTFLMSGQVFRRDEIDSTHFPIFHQVEGVRTISRFDAEISSRASDSHAHFLKSLLYQPSHDINDAMSAMIDLVRTLESVVHEIFGIDVPIRWQECKFPFTQPSVEMEIYYRDRWVEVLGSGILRAEFIQKFQPNHSSISWAFGLGLDRLAMILYDIPDIRLLWSDDERFLRQFENGHDTVNKFRPFSSQPAAYRDLSIWVGDGFSSNDVYEIIRSWDNGYVESVKMVAVSFCNNI